MRAQSQLSAQCDAILRPTGDVVEHEGRLFIGHERAAPVQSPVVMGSDGGAQRAAPPDIATLWWLTWSACRAMQAAGTAKVTHGGVQFACVYRDEVGRVKLGDFGIAPAFEMVCGVDARRRVVCDPADGVAPQGRQPSGLWRLMSEEAHGAHGWIAPYFGHELLEGRTRLNPRSDQFALGTLLFIWATGVHPYGVELSDPTQIMYFQLEPFPLEDERPEWADAFERNETGVATSADHVILAWRELTGRLLASNPKDRFDSLDACMELVRRHVDEQRWSAASRALSEALQRIEAGDVEAFLERAAPLAAPGALPALWQEHVAAYVAYAESQKERIARRKALERRLSSGQEALEAQDFATARAVAEEVRGAPESDEALRESAAALLRQCDETEELLRSGAAELARQNLEQAREALQESALADARRFAELVRNDPAAPKSFADSAVRLLSEIDQAERAVSGHLSELTQATVERREGKLDEAAARIAALLASPGVPDSVAAQARLLAQDIAETRERLALAARSLDEAAAAVERLDLAAARDLLDRVPVKRLPQELAARRQSVRERAERVATALELRGTAARLLEDFRPADADEALRQALGLDGLPEALRRELDALVERCREAVAEAARRAVEQALAALQRAEAQYEALEPQRCREVLDRAVLPLAELPEDARHRAGQLRSACDVLDAALPALRRGEQLVESGEFDQAESALADVPARGVPAELIRRREALAQRIAEQRAAFARQQVEKLAALLDDAERRLDEGGLDEAESGLRSVESSPFLTDALRARLAEDRGRLAALRPLHESLDRAERALRDGAPDRAAELLAALPREAAWVAARADAIERRIAEARDQARQAALARGEAALKAARAALDRLAPTEALAAVESARAELALDAELARRAEALQSEAGAQREWLPRLERLQAALTGGQYVQVFKGAEPLAAERGIPDLVARRVRKLGEEAKQRIAERQEQIKAELAELSAEIDRRQHRARRVAERVQAIASDPLAAKVQKSDAEALLRKFEALPPPRSRAVPAAAAVGVLVLAVGGAIVATIFRDRPGGNGSNTPVVPTPPRKSPAERLAAALPTLTAQAEEAARRALGDGPRRPFTLAFVEPDRFPSTLRARVGRHASDRPEFSGVEVSVGAFDEAALDAPAPAADRWAPLIAALRPEPPAPPPVRKADLAALQGEADAAARRAHGTHRPFALGVEPADDPNGELFATVDGTERVALGRLTDGTPAEGWIEALVAAVKPAAVVAPEKPFTDALAELLEEARRAIGRADVVLTPAEPADPSDFGIEGSFDGRALVGLKGLTYAAGRFSRTADAIARHFVSQANALESLARPGVVLDLGDAFADYRGAAELVEPRTALATAVDPQTGAVTVRGRARLSKDPRGSAGFELQGVVDGNRIAADETAVAAFAAYLDGLRAERLPAAPGSIGGSAIPAYLSVGPVRAEGDGAACELLAEGRRVAELRFTWDAKGLEYAADEAGAISQVRDWLARSCTPETLGGAWAASVEAVAPRSGEAGSDFIRAARLRAATAKADQSAAPAFALDVSVTIGPESAPSDSDPRNVSIDWRVRVADQGLAFDAALAEGVRAAMAAAIAAKSADERFLSARADEALAALAPGASDPQRQIEAQGSSPTLSASLTVDGRTERYRWSWDASRLAFVDPQVVPVGPLALLSGLAQSPRADPVAFVRALRAVTAYKCEVYSGGAGGRAVYQPDPKLLHEPPPSDAQAARAELLAISRGLHARIAADPRIGPAPLVFVEYAAQEGQLFGLGWLAAAGANGELGEVLDPVVWAVAQGPASNDLAGATAYHERLRGDAAAGDELLRLIPGALSASADGRWGMVVAPAGALWAVRWPDVRFSPRRFDDAAPLRWPHTKEPIDAGAFDHLGAFFVLSVRDQRNNVPVYPQVGIWTVPCLAGHLTRRGVRELNPGLEGFTLSQRSGTVGTVFVLANVARQQDDWSAVNRISRPDFGRDFWKAAWSPQSQIWSFSLRQE